MFPFRRPRCSCGGRIRKVEFYLDPYGRWDHYYCCTQCGAHGDTVEACRAAGVTVTPVPQCKPVEQ